MCGIAGILSIEPQRALKRDLLAMQSAIRHRGPDGQGCWVSKDAKVGLAHVRLSVIDLSPAAAQPMRTESGNVITYNGEIYNYIELRHELGAQFPHQVRYRSHPTRVRALGTALRRASARHVRLRSMGRCKARAFCRPGSIWHQAVLLLVRRASFAFASEIKALLPLRPAVETDMHGLHDYFCFQFCLNGRTLFSGVKQLQPAHCGYVSLDGSIGLRKYWEVQYEVDWHHTETYFVDKLQHCLRDSIEVHLRADVEVGAYASGGVDSSLVAVMAHELRPGPRSRFSTDAFSRAKRSTNRATPVPWPTSEACSCTSPISASDFVDNIAKVIYHLDQPVAGPGSFPQYMVSRTVRDHLKVVLGGQGGDEIFGGYARYLIAYFEQCIKGAIDGTMQNGNFVVTYESIIPSLATLKQYKPLIQEFWSSGIFDARDQRYFRLINRSNTFGSIVDWNLLEGAPSFEDFQDDLLGRQRR